MPSRNRNSVTMVTVTHVPAMVVSAAAKVFSIPELVEMILSFYDFGEVGTFEMQILGIRELHKFKRVNSTFNAIISQSKVFRIIMWLERPSRKSFTETRINPILFAGSKHLRLPICDCFELRSTYRGCIQGRDEPISTAIIECQRNWGSRDTLAVLCALLEDTGGSWKDMVITNGHCTVIWPGARKYGEVSRDEGSTLRDLMKQFLEQMRRGPALLTEVPERG